MCNITKKSEIVLKNHDQEKHLQVDQVDNIAITYMPDWIPIDKLEAKAEKFGLKLYRVKGNEGLVSVRDNKKIQLLGVDELKDFKIRYVYFLQKLHDWLSEESLLYDYYINDDNIKSFAQNIIEKVNKHLDNLPN